MNSKMQIPQGIELKLSRSVSCESGSRSPLALVSRSDVSENWIAISSSSDSEIRKSELAQELGNKNEQQRTKKRYF